MPFSRREADGKDRRHGNPSSPSEIFKEAAYLKSLGEKQTQVRVKLQNGETMRGWIEYYDAAMIRLTRQSEPNLFIFKHDIMYIVEEPASKD